MAQTLFEKLNFKDERNVLVQGLPVNIERCFLKVNYTKNVTPLLRKNKIDFALLFAIDRAKLESMLPDVLSCLARGGKLWIVYPKRGSKIFSDLNSEQSWRFLRDNAYHLVRTINIDHAYDAVMYARNMDGLYAPAEEGEEELEEIDIPEDIGVLFEEFTDAAYYFETLSPSYQQQFLYWIAESPDADTRRVRIQVLIERLLNGDFFF